MIDNHKRLFGGLLSVEAWHSEPNSKKVVNVHADVVFQTVRLGQEASSPIRFKLSLRRADVVFIIPPNEPLKALQESVARDQPSAHGRLTVKSSKASSSEANAEAAANLSKLPNTKLNVSGKIGAQTSSEQSYESEDSVRLIISTQTKDANGNYVWSLSPSIGNHLQGRAWDALTQPRLSVIDSRDNERQLEGACRIDVRCKREDLLIGDITLKDNSVLKTLVGDNLYHNRVAAAESYIRNILSKESLDHANLEEPYSDLTVANVRVEPVTQ